MTQMSQSAISVCYLGAPASEVASKFAVQHIQSLNVVGRVVLADFASVQMYLKLDRADVREEIVDATSSELVIYTGENCLLDAEWLWRRYKTYDAVCRGYAIVVLAAEV